MARFHDSGTICKAKLRPCPLGVSSEDHIVADSVSEFELKLAAKMEQQEVDALSSTSKGDTAASRVFGREENTAEVESFYSLLGQVIGQEIAPTSFDQANGRYSLLTTLEKIDRQDAQRLRKSLEEKAPNENKLWKGFKQKEKAHGELLLRKAKLLRRGAEPTELEELNRNIRSAEAAETTAKDSWYTNRKDHELAIIADFSRSWNPRS